MTAADATGKLVFYHAPNTRSTATRILLEELGAPYELAPIDMKKGEQRQPAYLAVNPMGKVPAIVHDGALVTESVAIFIYLADAFPAARLAPAIGERNRGVCSRVRLKKRLQKGQFLVQAGDKGRNGFEKTRHKVFFFII